MILSREEISIVIQCIDLAIKQSKNSIESAIKLIPIVKKLTAENAIDTNDCCENGIGEK